MNKDHINASLEKIRVIFERASDRIDALKAPEPGVRGEKIPATKLAAELALEFSTPGAGPALYPVLKYLFDGYPGVKISRGVNGGIEKVLPVTPTVADIPGTDPIV